MSGTPSLGTLTHYSNQGNISPFPDRPPKSIRFPSPSSDCPFPFTMFPRLMQQCIADQRNVRPFTNCDQMGVLPDRSIARSSREAKTTSGRLQRAWAQQRATSQSTFICGGESLIFPRTTISEHCRATCRLTHTAGLFCDEAFDSSPSGRSSSQVALEFARFCGLSISLSRRVRLVGRSVF
jgi:hypothetical protein